MKDLNKIFLGFLLVFLMFVTVGSISYHSMNTVSQEYEDLILRTDQLERATFQLEQQFDALFTQIHEQVSVKNNNFDSSSFKPLYLDYRQLQTSIDKFIEEQSEKSIREPINDLILLNKKLQKLFVHRENPSFSNFLQSRLWSDIRYRKDRVFNSLETYLTIQRSSLLSDVAHQKETVLFSTLLLTLVGALITILIWGYIHKIVKQKESLTTELTLEKEVAEKAVAEREEFLSRMSHELRTPLNGVLGAANLLIYNNPREDQEKNLRLLRLSSDNLNTMISDILDYNKIAEGRIELRNEDFVFSDLLYAILDGFREIINDKNIELEMDIPQAMPKVLRGDANRLSQVISNLVSNAVKFTEVGGVLVKIRLMRLTADDVEFKVAVSDTGIGIEAQHLDKIFEGFTQLESNTTRRFGGSGLGLTISKLLINKMGGDLKANSVLGEGSTFTASFKFNLPVHISSSSKPQYKRDWDVTLVGKKVLIVEDNQMNIFVVERFLKIWGMEVDIARNGKEGANKAVNESYDLILMDIQMPVMDGFDATQIIRQDEQKFLKPAVPIIALTASALLEVKKDAEDAGMDDLVTKPFNPEELKYKVMKLLLYKEVKA